MITTLAVLTATVVGVMVGVEFAVAVFVGPMLRRLPVGSWIEASADGARVLGRVMPFWYIGSLLLTAWLAAAKWGGPAGGAAVAAAALLVVSVVMSVTLLVPIAKPLRHVDSRPPPRRLARAAAALGPAALRAGGDHRRGVRADTRRRDSRLSAGRAGMHPGLAPRTRQAGFVAARSLEPESRCAHSGLGTALRKCHEFETDHGDNAVR